MKRWALSLSMAALVACGGPGDEPKDEGPGLRVPRHGPVPVPPDFDDDPETPAKVELGTYLFFDERLSGSGHTDCSACHVAATSFQDNLRRSIPDRSYPSDTPATERNTTSLLNVVYAPVSRWDGSGIDLLEGLVRPFAEANMNLGDDVPSAQIELKQRLAIDLPAYPALFEAAFGEDIGALPPEQIWWLTARALRAFVRKAVSRDSAFDRWNAGDDAAMNEAAQRGLALFEGKARCGSCHSGAFFTDFGFHNVSSSPPGPGGSRADEGRYLVTGDEADRGKFLTPTLRSAFQTGPYFHDGSVFTVQQVIQHKASPAVTQDPARDALLEEPLELTDDEIADIAQFIAALRGADIRGTFTEPAPDTP